MWYASWQLIRSVAWGRFCVTVQLLSGKQVSPTEVKICKSLTPLVKIVTLSKGTSTVTNLKCTLTLWNGLNSPQLNESWGWGPILTASIRVKYNKLRIQLSHNLDHGESSPNGGPYCCRVISRPLLFLSGHFHFIFVSSSVYGNGVKMKKVALGSNRSHRKGL